MSQGLRVALISHEFPPYAWGGISSNCQDLALALAKNGISTTVFSGRANPAKIERTNEYLEVVRLPCLDLPPRPLWFQLQNFKTFMKLCEDHDIIHGVNPLSSVTGVLLGKRLRKPVVTSIHEVYSKDLVTTSGSPIRDLSVGDLALHVLEYPLHESLVRICLKTSDHIVVCGYSARDDMSRVYKNLDFRKVSVIHNGINFDKTIFQQNFTDSSNDFPTITFFGRLIYRKGILHLVRAMRYVKENFPGAVLQIFGKGFLEKKIENLARQLGISQQIAVHGHVSYEELMSSVRRSTVVVLPSLYEVGPFVSALETMALAKPLVAFDFPFAREFISNMHTGILAKAGNITDLADKISLVLSDSRLRQSISKKAYSYVRTNHDWRNLALRYLAMYRSLSG